MVGIQNEILAFVEEQSKIYPVTIVDIEENLGLKKGGAYRHIKALEKQGLVESKKVAQPKGGVTFYKNKTIPWLENLGLSCYDCQNRSTIATCIFYEELAKKGIRPQPEREKIKLTKNTFACENYIQRETGWRKKSLEEFLNEQRKITKTSEGLVIAYHCANENCKAKLSSLGGGLIAKLGSSVVRCNECGSFYKTLYNEKKGIFIVNYNKEKGAEYKKNFNKYVKGEEPEKQYSSERLGIVIHELQDCTFNFRTNTLTVNNWIGKLEEMSYLVVKKREEYEQVVEIVERLGFDGRIEVILGADKIISPKPVKQQVGMLQLLREIKIVNKDFCLAMLRSRRTVIEKLLELFQREREGGGKEAIKTIEEIIKEVRGKEWITAREWNVLEMRAGNMMWKVVSEYLEKLGITFPGRGKSRLVEDIAIPQRKFYAYSKIDTLINAVYGTTGKFVKKYCSEINFCWDGLPGLCHGETKGGVFGLHLDLQEPVKILTIPYMIEAIKEERIEMEEILYLRGRYRQKIFYIQQETEVEEKIEELVEEMLEGEINEKRGRNIIREYYWKGKYWLNDIQKSSNYYEIKHHGERYQPWAIIKEKIWQVMGEEERKKLIEKIKEEHEKIAFKPLTIEKIK